MTKVKDLVKDAFVMKSTKFDLLNPEITVLLPTFRRGDNGLLEKCIISILKQTFKNFELIIIDDASKDSTASIIKKYMEQDNRIMWIRHSKNIGLPAVSIFEGYQKSRGNFFFWAFDDNEFIPTAMEELYDYEKSHPLSVAVYGKAQYSYKGKKNFFGKTGFEYSKLWDTNYIPNSPMLMRKFLFDEFGWYDPHIIMARLCDWDLWLRISRKYSFGWVDKVLSKEKGVEESDSLCNSYAMDLNLVREWISIQRNKLLKPENFLNYDVDKVPSFLSKTSQRTFSFLYKEKYNKFFWSNCNVNIGEGEPYIMVYVPFRDACTEFYFCGLDESIQNRIIFFSYDALKEHQFYSLFSLANAVIFSRNLDNVALNLMDVCIKFKIPCYYYTDDNLFNLGIYKYSSRIHRILKKCTGIIVSNNNLKKFFEAKKINTNYMLVNPVLPKDIVSNFFKGLSKFKAVKKINILYASNSRENGLLKVLPYLNKLKTKYEIKLILFKRKNMNLYEEILNFCFDNGIEVEVLYPEYSLGAFITLIQSKNIHFIIHPEIVSDNAKNKSLNFLLVAYLSSSFLLHPRKEPYLLLEKYQYLKDMLYSSFDDGINFIFKILENEQYRDLFSKEMKNFCDEYFNRLKNEVVLKKLMFKSNDRKINMKKFVKLCKKARKRHLNLREWFFSINYDKNRFIFLGIKFKLFFSYFRKYFF